MVIALLLAFGLVAALVWRHGDGPGGRQTVWAVGGLALAVRLGAVLVIHVCTLEAHIRGVWLDDEAAFFQATQWLLPNPFDGNLPLGLDHLAGDGYLGLTTALALANSAVADATAFRVVNAALGSAVVVLAMLVARRLYGPRAALASGLALALWPTLVLWSVTMLRDTLAALAIVVVWWALGRARELHWARALGALFLSLVLALSLRPYLGAAIVVGVGAWAVWPMLARLPVSRMAMVGAGAAALTMALLVTQTGRLEGAAHGLLYRQTVSRVELYGRLYTDFLYPVDPAGPGEEEPIRVSGTIAIVNPRDGWVLGGVIQQLEGPDQVLVAFTDGSMREVPRADLVPLNAVAVPPQQLVAMLAPNLIRVLDGTSPTTAASSPAWIVAAFAWDALLVLGVLGVVRQRVDPRKWLFPLCLTAASVLALVAIPGAPANADRHRTNQTVPLLAVLASGLIVGRRRETTGLADLG